MAVSVTLFVTGVSSKIKYRDSKPSYYYWAIGQFLTDELALDNLDVEFSRGHVHLKELQLNTEVLNDLIADLPIIITDGRIGGIIANVPWKNIWSCDCVLEIHNLQLVVVPEQVKHKNAKSSTEDSHILSSSIHFAGDFLRHEIPPEEDEELHITNSLLDNSETLPPQPPQPQQTQNIEGGGVEVLARIIDKIMSNVKVVFKDTLIRLQHKSNYSLDDNQNGGDGSSCDTETLRNYFFDLEIPTISYRDETQGLGDGDDTAAGAESSVILPLSQSEILDSSKNVAAAASLSKLNNDLSLGAEEFTEISAINHNDLPLECEEDAEIPEIIPEIPDSQDSGDEFYDSHLANNEDRDGEKKIEEKFDTSSTESSTNLLYEAMIFTCGEHENLGRVTIKQNSPPTIQFDTSNASSSYMFTQEAIQQASSTQTWDLNCTIQSIIAVLTPGQVGLLADLMKALSESKIAGHERKFALNTESEDDSIHQETSRMQMPPTFSSGGGGSRSNNTSMRSPLNAQDRSDEGTGAFSSSRTRSKQNIGNDPYYQINIDSNNIDNNNNFYELPLGERSPMYSTSSSTKYPHTFKTSSHRHPSQNPYTTASSPLASTTLPTVSPPNLDIKLNISLIELYLLYKNDSIPGQNFFIDDRTSESLDHLKFEIRDFTSHLRTCEPKTGTNARRRNLSVSSSSNNISSGVGVGGGLQSGGHHHQKIVDSEQKPKVSLEISISDLSVLEWLEGFVDGSSSSEEKDSLPPFKSYNRVLSFDPAILDSYESDEAKFLSFSVSQKNDDQELISSTSSYQKSKSDSSNRPLAGGSGGNKHSDQKMIRIKIDVESQENEGNNHSVIPQSSAPNLNVDLEPFHLHFDLRLIDRLENYIRILDSINDTTKSSRDEETVSRDGGTFTEIHSGSQHIIADLDTPRVTELSSVHQSRVRIHCKRIRAWIICPDLNCSNSAQDKEANNYRIHSDLLVADIDQISIQQLSSRASDFSEESSNLSTADLQKRVKIEFVSTNLFLKRAQESEAKCFLIVKTLDSHPTSRQHTLKSTPNSIPNVELTYRPDVADQLFFEGSGFPISPFSQAHASYEGSEERVNWPMENEEEDILRFKHRTIESSLFVLNCSFPVIRIRISKSLYDALQILLNDLSLWQPSFTKPSTTTATISDNNDNTNTLSHSMYKSNAFVADGFNENMQQSDDSYDENDPALRRRMEGGFIDERRGNVNVVKPSLASLVVLMANVEIDILCGQESKNAEVGVNAYQLNMSELRFFTAIKHRGKTKNTRPMISVIIFSSFETNGNLSVKQTNLTLSVNGVTLRFDSLEPKWPEDLVGFFQGPELIPYVDMPSQFTMLFVSINESSIDYIPKDIPARMVIALDSLKASTTLMLDVPLLSFKIIAQNTDLLVIDNVKDLNEKLLSRLGNGVIDAKRYWKTIGLAHTANVDFAEILLRINKEQIFPKFEITLTNENLTIETCADSFHTLLSLINHIASKNKKSVENKPAKHPTTTPISNEISDNVLASLDEEAFMPPKPNTTKDASVGTSDLTIMDEFYFMDDNDNRGATMHRKGKNAAVLPNETHLFESNGDEFKNVPSTRTVSLGSDEPFDRESSDSESSDRESQDKKSQDKKSQDEEWKWKWHMVGKDEKPEPLNFVEDHFSIPTASELEESQEELPQSLMRVRIRDFNLVWKLYDGYDWEETRNTVLENIAHAKAQARKQSANSAETATGSDQNNNRPASPLDSVTSSYYERLYVGSTFRHSEYEGSSSQAASEVDYTVDDRSDVSSLVGSGLRAGNENLSRRDSGGGKTADLPRATRSRSKLGRSRSSKLDIRLEKMNLEFDLFPENEQLAFRLLLSIRDVEILDNIKSSAWRKFLSHMRPENDTSPREAKSNMVRIELQCVRPVPTDPSEEFRLKTRLLPLRFHIDQDALNFVIRFFSFQNTSSKTSAPKSEDDTYIQYFEIQPIIMKIDYKPKHIDYTNLKEGNLVELMNFFHFDAADMALHSVKLRGIKGWQRLFEELGAAWLPHIKNTQVPNVVSGVAPIRSLVNLGSGVADLVLLPIEQYKKDGRIIRGLQKGTQSFAKATTMEAINLGTKLAVGTQILLEHADEIFSFETQEQPPSSSGGSTKKSRSASGAVHSGSNLVAESDSDSDDNVKELISKYANQPADINEGIEEAYKSLRQNIGTAAHTIFAVPMEVYEKTGTQGTVKAVIRAVPVAVLKPMIGASEAVSKTLLGLRNTIDPNKLLQMEDKYKKR
ncbi:5160_t:CDS:10 [Ambispora gerdemannii]|uniref:Autophagy-related protein 2 n=1 Tax=Ambispora gerdemannii TaxID=144530 RepID=A0A9N8VUA7_9GLOM|nr:5160_t:CDS:10 [Ambispora gerdemannii]